MGKGVRVNLGKNGISSVTFGKRGAPHVTVGKRGTYVGTSIPGTGISYSQKISGKKSSASKPAKNKTKASSPTATAQLPIVTQQLETPASPSFFDTGSMVQTNGSTILCPESTSPDFVSPNRTNTSFGGTNTPPSGGKHAKTPKRPGSWKRWIVIILVAVVALAVGNMSADPTQSNQYKELQQQLTTQKRQNGKLQQQVDELNQKLDDIQDLKDQLDQQKAEQDSQQKQLDQQKSEQEQKQQEQDQKQQEQDQRQTQLDEREKNIAQREEAKKQAQEQQLAQVAQQQQSQAPAATSFDRAHGGAFCSTAGATAQSDRSASILTCRVASDGRLRWGH
ncbi:DUF4236 domain-containing protein [Bifidobacterium ruminantium]|uniref:DUF4236 domain-containing protein n=1 Tax=Bifidobacterium ruminantium TaxID=78346 RepID=UPI001ED9B614